jgi:hypothetical protein
MPTINLDSILNTTPTWDLTVQINEKQYRIRRMDAKDIQAVVGAGPTSDDSTRKAVQGWFEGEAPDMTEWRTEHFSAVFSAIAAYYQHSVVNHRTKAIESAVRLAIGMK